MNDPKLDDESENTTRRPRTWSSTGLQSAGVVFAILTSIGSLIVGILSYQVSVETKTQQDQQLRLTYASRVVIAFIGPQKILVQNYSSLPLPEVSAFMIQGRPDAPVSEEIRPTSPALALGYFPPCSESDITAWVESNPAFESVALAYSDVNGRRWLRAAAGEPTLVDPVQGYRFPRVPAVITPMENCAS